MHISFDKLLGDEDGNMGGDDAVASLIAEVSEASLADLADENDSYLCDSDLEGDNKDIAVTMGTDCTWNYVYLHHKFVLFSYETLSKLSVGVSSVKMVHLKTNCCW